MSDDEIAFSKKKKKMVLDDEGEGEQINVITTKTGTENAARDHYDHSKANGDKSSDANKSSPKKQDAHKKPESKPPQKPAPSQKPKEGSSNTSAPKSGDNKDKKETKPEGKGEVKPKPSGDVKKPEANGEQKKKPMEEEKKAGGEKKPQAKPPQKKRVVESESESEESASESEGSDSDDEREKKKKKKQSPAKKPQKKDDKKEKVKQGPDGIKRVAKSKDTLVYEVLKRWWYALPDWPPVGFDYATELANKKLRKVDHKYWRIEPELDGNGNKKVYEIPSFVGVYKDSKGEVIDLRPKDSCPSYKNFKTKSITELCELHAAALKKQVEELETADYVDQILLNQLKAELKRAERTLDAQKAKAK